MPSFAVPSQQPNGGGISISESLVPTGAAGTLTLSLNGNSYFLLNLSGITSGTPVVSFTGAIAGASALIEVVQGGTACNLSFPSGTLQAGGGGATYTASGTNVTDLIAVVYNGTAYRIEVTTGYA